MTRYGIFSDYFRVTPDTRDLNYDKYLASGNARTQADEAYTSHSTRLLTVDETVDKILTTDFVRQELENWTKR